MPDGDDDELEADLVPRGPTCDVMLRLTDRGPAKPDGYRGKLLARDQRAPGVVGEWLSSGALVLSKDTERAKPGLIVVVDGRQVEGSDFVVQTPEDAMTTELIRAGVHKGSGTDLAEMAWLRRDAEELRARRDAEQKSLEQVRRATEELRDEQARIIERNSKINSLLYDSMLTAQDKAQQVQSKLAGDLLSPGGLVELLQQAAVPAKELGLDQIIRAKAASILKDAGLGMLPSDQMKAAIALAVKSIAEERRDPATLLSGLVDGDPDVETWVTGIVAQVESS